MDSKRKRLTLKEILCIFEFWAFNTNWAVRALAERLSVGKIKIADIVANKHVLYKIWAANGEEKWKSIKLLKTNTFVIDNKLLN